MDRFTIIEIELEMTRTRQLLETKILWGEDQMFRRSVLIEVLINMKDLLVKADKMGRRINFTDDVIPDPGNRIADVTGLISNFRDAACHIDSGRKKIRTNVVSFGEIRGSGIMFEGTDLQCESKYNDDIAIIMGKNVLYLGRHIERAFLELESFLPVIVGNYWAINNPIR